MMKKMLAMILSLALVLALGGCAGTTVVVGNCTCPPESHTQAAAPGEMLAEGALKTGLAILPDLSGSANATAADAGKASFDVTVVAVTVDENGVIRNCVIDSVGADAAFDASGVPATVGMTEVLSKNEKGFDYGMVAYGGSKIGKEWFEQAAALAEYAQGKTVEQLKNGAVNESGKAKDADLATKATITIGSYVDGIEAAVANAKALGAESGQELKLAVSATLETSAKEAGGMAQLNLDAVAMTMENGVITSCTIDSLQAPVEFDGTGTITTDLSAAPRTKQQLGFDYGMVAYNASKIGKEWFEQVDAFCAYVSGKTPAEVAGIAVTESNTSADVDLAAKCSIQISGFQALIAKAAG